MLDVLPKRLGKYGLTIHPEKTWLLPFRRLASRVAPTDGPRVPPPGTFDFLGFTHFWSRSKQGLWVVKRTTAGGRFRRALTKIAVWCRQNRHLPIRVQYEILAQKLQGRYAYYGGLIGNQCRLLRFRREVVRLWQKWLSRRHRRGRWPWPRFTRLLKVLVFPWPRGWVTPCVVNP